MELVDMNNVNDSSLSNIERLKKIFAKSPTVFYNNVRHGSIGVILFDYFYERYSDDDVDDSCTMERTLELYRDLLIAQKGKQYSRELVNAKLLCYLVNNQMIELDLDKMISTVEHRECAALQTTFSDGINSIALSGGFLLERLKSTKDENIARNIKETLAYVFEEIEYQHNQFQPKEILYSESDLRNKLRFEIIALFFIGNIKPYKIYTFKQQFLEEKLLCSFTKTLISFLERSAFKYSEKMLVSIETKALLSFFNLEERGCFDLSQRLVDKTIASFNPQNEQTLSELSSIDKIICAKMIMKLKKYQDLPNNLSILYKSIISDFNNFISIKLSDKHCGDGMFTNIGLGGLAGIALVLLENEVGEEIDWHDTFTLF